VLNQEATHAHRDPYREDWLLYFDGQAVTTFAKVDPNLA
jgi:hypothetical protein